MLGGVAALMILIVGLVWMLFQLNNNRAARHTFEQLKACLSGMDISKDMTELVIPNDRCNEDVFVLDMGQFTKLQLLWVGSSSFEHVRYMKLSGLRQLERVVIGERSFTNSTGELIVHDCDALKELRVGRESFKKYEYLGLSELPSLETVRMDGLSFIEASELKMIGLSGLKKMTVGEDCFSQRSGRFVLSQCKALSEVSIGSGSFAAYSVFQLNTLPGLEVLRVGEACFEMVEEWSLEQLNALKQVSIGMNSFSKSSGVLSVKNCDKLESFTIGGSSFNGYTSLAFESVPLLKSVKVESNCFTSASVLKLDGMSGLQVFEVGNHCFANVKELQLVGMSELKTVVIGENSFTNEKNDWGNDSERHFYLKNCPKVKELKMGRYSFSDYSVIEIANVDNLEVIEIGDLNATSYNFYSASLRLQSVNMR